MKTKHDWLKNAVHEDRAGMFADVSTEEIQKELAHLKKMRPFKEGTPQYTKMHQLLFALRARKNHGFRSK